MRYFITFSCYGAHLHGAESGSVDRHHDAYGNRLADASPERVAAKRKQMDQAPYILDRQRRTVVLGTLREVCLHRDWTLLAAHVRTNHVHVVVEAEAAPEKVMHAFKAYASRALNYFGTDEPDRKRWARHGSTRWLWKDEDVREATRYVVLGQGESMEVYVEEWPSRIAP
jgi:REP element-mobilizing transposase RayT